MRMVQSIVGVQGIVLLVLLGVWWQHGEVAPPQPPGEVLAAKPIAPTETNTGSLVTPAASLIERTRAITPVDAGSSGQSVILQGRLTGVTPLPDTDSVRLSLRQDNRWRQAEVTKTGAYAIAGLRAGTWLVRCQANGCRQQEFEYTLDHREIQRLDIELQSATVLKVFVRTLDGARLQAELSKLGIWQGLRVIATATPLAGDLMPTESSSVGDVGIGRHRQPSDLNQRSDPDGDEGVLELDEPPPANAALLLRHMVIAQQRIHPGQTELHFEVDPAAVHARFATVRLRILNADGQPVAAARVRLSTAQGGGQAGRTDEQGACSIENVMPGLAAFSIMAKSPERYSTHLTIAPGAKLDLGDIRLTAASEVMGRVITSDGKAIGATIQWTALDLWRPPHPLMSRRSARADGDGHFQLYGTGQRRYTVSARSADKQVGFAIVDGAIANSERFNITVRPTQPVKLRATQRMQVRAVVITDPNGNVLQVCRVEPRWPEGNVNLPDGDYRMLVYDGLGNQLASERLHVAGAAIEKVLP